MTLTAIKREKHKARYQRKDARTAVYRVLYGRYNRRSNNPELDKRSLPVFWDFQNAEKVFRENIDKADFAPAQKAHLMRRLEQVRHHKGHQPTE